MKIKKIIIYCAWILLICSPVFSYIGEKYEYFYQDSISKLYEIARDTWEITIIKKAKPYGYTQSSETGTLISFKGKSKVKPLYPKRESDYESFYLVIMPPKFSNEKYVFNHPSDTGQAMESDKLLGIVHNFRIFYRITGSVEGEMPSWLNWKEDIKKVLEIKN